MPSSHPESDFQIQQFRPHKKGSRKMLFDLESDVMEVLWNRGRTRLVVRDVHKILESNRDIAYTTVMTTMDRLWKKGVLERAREGKAYAYWPRLSRDEFYRQVAVQVLDSLLPEVSDPLLSSFVESVAELDTAQLDRLEEFIRQKRNELAQESGDKP